MQEQRPSCLRKASPGYRIGTTRVVLKDQQQHQQEDGRWYRVADARRFSTRDRVLSSSSEGRARRSEQLDGLLGVLDHRQVAVGKHRR